MLATVVLGAVALGSCAGSAALGVHWARRHRGWVKVQAVVVQVRWILVGVLVTFDYPVPGGWARATKSFLSRNHMGTGFLGPVRGRPITVLVDPRNPQAPPQLLGFGFDGIFALMLGVCGFVALMAAGMWWTMTGVFGQLPTITPSP
ncbi:MAG: hypothetical protein FWE61_02765 [Micrococcales bacterium]|nr:hypothetical protein [Micrococcales bacterium]